MHEIRKPFLFELEPHMGDRMAKAITVAGYSFAEIAETMKVSRNTISNWVHVRTMPRMRDLQLLAQLTGVTVQWILTGYDVEIPTGFEDIDPGEDYVRPLGLEPRTHWFRVSMPETPEEFLDRCARGASNHAEVERGS